MNTKNSRKQVGVRISQELVNEVMTHQERLSSILGGTNVSFTTALAHLLQEGLRLVKSTAAEAERS